MRKLYTKKTGYCNLFEYIYNAIKDIFRDAVYHIQGHESLICYIWLITCYKISKLNRYFLMKKITTYNATFDLINSIENSYFQKTSKFISQSVIFFNKRFLVRYRKFTNEISPHVFGGIYNLLDWLWIKIFRPFFLLFRGVVLIF